MTERSDLIERAGERNKAIATDAAISRLEAGHTAKCRRLADRAARVGANRERGHSSGQTSGCSTARAARHAADIPGIGRLEVGAVLCRAAHREFIHVRLADENGVRS